jgi:hypothetical protein
MLTCHYTSHFHVTARAFYKVFERRFNGKIFFVEKISENYRLRFFMSRWKFFPRARPRLEHWRNTTGILCWGWDGSSRGSSLREGWMGDGRQMGWLKHSCKEKQQNLSVCWRVSNSLYNRGKQRIEQCFESEFCGELKVKKCRKRLETQGNTEMFLLFTKISLTCLASF